MSSKAYDRITGQIIALLEQGTVPWHKPWKASTGLPRNLVSKKQYRGINVLLLHCMSYESPCWLTFRQAIMLGGTVKKGEKACPVVFWKRLTVGEKDRQMQKRQIPASPLLHHVFNVAQCEGASRTATRRPKTARRRCHPPEDIVANMPQRPPIKDGFTHAFYSLREDYVGMPHGMDRFTRNEEFYNTLFHELAHSDRPQHPFESVNR